MSTNNESLSIKNWAESDRPREKLLAQGERVLSDAELLAIILGSGSKNESAVELARRILQSVDNDLNQLGKCRVHELMKFKGIGQAKAINIVATTELGRRRKAQEPTKRAKIKIATDVVDIMSPLLSDLPIEEFWIILLNQANTVIKQVRISSGGIAGTAVDIRIILKHAIENMATALILCHNHPSGNTQASNDDIQTTTQIAQAAKIMNIRLLDHIIIAGNQYLSFCNEGII